MKVALFVNLCSTCFVIAFSSRTSGALGGILILQLIP